MSRTDDHAPMRVKLARRDLGSQPYHSCHRTKQPCDLPARPPADRESTTRCHWTLHYTGTNVCACTLCSDRPGRRRMRRRERHDVKRDLQACRD